MANPKVYLRILQVAASAVFIGRAWQHLVWDAPFRSFFWDEQLLRPFVEGSLGIDWTDYVTSPATELAISRLTSTFGVLYLICGVGVWLLPRFRHWIIPLLYVGTFGLILLAWLYYKEHFYFSGQFFEYTLQWASPLFLVAFLRSGQLTDRLVFWMKIAIALTFTCHGLYAIGWYPRPGYFMQMTMVLLDVGTEGAADFLWWAGVLDFVVSVLIFFPIRIALPALCYATLWGFSTSVARVAANVHPELWINSLSQWWHETLFRFPHFVIPALLFVFFWSKRPGSRPG